ncbi:hypothetical protein DFH09DRAFT_1074038 [Mycena vulgaris]|nr:hypothetical protein DFH09DRAFT_1074038 [Mycena vulgaris]
MPPSSPLTELAPSPENVGVKTPRPLLPGMEKGYAMSPMGEILRLFLEESEDENSLFVRTNMIISKRELSPKDVHDRGIAFQEAFPRFNLEPDYGNYLTALIAEMQDLVIRAALLIPARRPEQYYVIDPHGSLMRVLLGAETLDEMTIAWHALRRRFELSHKYLDKYDSEYKSATEEEVLLSPISTAVDVYDQLAVFPTGSSHNVARLTHLYEKVPHLRQTMPSNWQASPSWLPGWIEAPRNLRVAFPDREPERNPVTVSYSDRGNREEGERWEPARTKVLSPVPQDKDSSKRSVKRVSIAPEDPQIRPPRGYGRDRTDLMNAPRVETVSESSREDGEERARDLSSYGPSSAYSVFGASTPFKSQNEFFGVPKSRDGSAPTNQVPNADLPNTLYGMAAPKAYGFGATESVSQGPKSLRRDSDFASWTGNVSARRAMHAEPEQGRIPAKGDFQRDVPPHMGDNTPNSGEHAGGAGPGAPPGSAKETLIREETRQMIQMTNQEVVLPGIRLEDRLLLLVTKETIPRTVGAEEALLEVALLPILLTLQNHPRERAALNL